MAEARVTKDIRTCTGTLSFPRVFESTKGKNKKGEDVWDIQIIIPKSEREGLKAILAAIKEVARAKWGDNWSKVNLPLRDGDKESGELTQDGSMTKGEKYPERLGCYFINARSTKPLGVYDRQRNLIPDSENGRLYGGCKGNLHLTFFPYNTDGNLGVGAGLNGVQLVADGTPLAAGKPAVESMFDLLEDEEGDEFGGLEDETVEEPVEPKPAAKKTAAKKAAAPKAAAPVEEIGDDDLEGIGDAVEDDSDLYAGLDDSDI